MFDRSIHNLHPLLSCDAKDISNVTVCIFELIQLMAMHFTSANASPRQPFVPDIPRIDF